jgi:ABC-type branched-subunit amino acid transport system substrate-binding protein
LERVKSNPPQNIPSSGAAQFVGRSHDLETLHQQLQGKDRVAIVAIAGMGGVGKTELAIQYAKKYAQSYPGGVFWLEAKGSNLADQSNQIVGFAQRHLKIPGSQELSNETMTTKQKITWCWQHWQPPGEVLLVLDDVIELANFREFLPPLDHQFRVLVTTHLKNLDATITELSLDVLSLEASLELLTRLINKDRNRIEGELKVAEDLCKWMGYLPLGLELVGRYLARNPDLSLIEILERLKNQGLQDKSINEQQIQKNSLMTSQKSLKETFESSWQQLDSNASQLAQLLGYLNINVIHWEQVESIAKQLNWTQTNLKDAKNQLNKLHFIQSSGQGLEKFHPLIKEFLREKVKKSGNIKRFRQAIDASMKLKRPPLPVWLKFSLFGLLLAVGGIALIYLIIQLYFNGQEKPLSKNYFTRGEEALINQNIKSSNPLCKQAFEKKNQGMQAFAGKQFSLAQENFQAAINLFKQANLQCSVDPETQIFLNNAKANIQGNPLTIAAVVPMNGSEQFNNLSEQVLRGVAHVQDNFNRSNGIEGQFLQVIVAKDDNKPEVGKRLAKHFGDNNIPGDTNFKGEVLGVIGHFTSDVTQPSGEIYEKKGLVAVSPISTAVRQSNLSPSGYQFNLSKYVFRTAPSDSIASDNLFKYAQTIPSSGKAAIFFNSKQIYSLSLKEAFEKKFAPQDVISCDLSKKTINTCIEITKNAKFLLLDIGSETANDVLLIIERNQNKLPLLGGDALYSDDKLPSEFGNKSKNMVVAVASHIELFSDSFKKESVRLWGTKYVGWRTATTYDAAQAIVEGLKRNPTRAGLYTALSSSNFSVEGATAKVQFDEKSHDRKVDLNIGVLVKVQQKCKPNGETNPQATDSSNYVFCLLKN